MVGNIPNFTDIDILRCFLKVDNVTSRLDLVKKLELGEGTVRTILNILKNNNLIESTQKGHSLSEKGIKILNNIKNEIEILNKLEYKEYKNFKNYGIVVKNINKIDQTTQLRDIGIKNGAEAVLILVFNKKLTTPGFKYDKDFSEFESYYKFKNNDVLIVTFANSEKLAEQSALSTVIELNKELKRFIKSLKKIIKNKYKKSL